MCLLQINFTVGDIAIQDNRISTGEKKLLLFVKAGWKRKISVKRQSNMLITALNWQMDLRKQLKFPEYYLGTTTNFLNKEKKTRLKNTF